MKSPFSLTGKYNSILAIITGALLASVLIVLLLIAPAWHKLKVLGTEIPAAEAKRDAAQQDSDALEKAKKFFQEKQADVETVNTTVPIEPNVPQILAIIESLARANNVFVTSFSPQQAGQGSGQQSAGQAPGSAPGGAQAVEINANFRGQYSSLINFFYGLEKSLRIVDVKTLTVSSSASGLEGSISFRAYYKPVEGGPQPQGTPAPSAGGTGKSQSGSEGGTK